ncbi:MAG: RodZ domain-containing protein [Rhizomicrobium sp.]|jgi:cytoskeleton protein RodZ
MTKVTHLTLDESGALSRKRIHLREISGDADTPLETVGQDLRAARLRRGDDLASVSRVLKIRKDHLEALEEDRLEALPGRTYAVGFVRSYADYLGLDPVQCVERFKGEIAGRQDSSQPPAIAQDSSETRLPHGWVVIAVVLLGLVAYGAWHLAMSADSLLRQPVAPVPDRMAPGSVIAHARPPAPGQAALNTPPPATTTQAPSAGATPQTAPPAGSANPAAVPGATPPADQTASLAPGQNYGLQNINPRVILRVRVTTNVLVQGPNGTVYLNRVLHPGDSYNVPNLVGVTLTTQNGGAIDLELDGQPMGSAGRTNKVTEALSLDPQAIVDRYNSGNSG